MDKQFGYSKPFVFVLMPFDERFSDVYELVIKSLQGSLDVVISRADALPFDGKGRSIYDRIMMAIDSADLIVADLSEKNPNVFYELGYARARGKIVVPLCCEDLVLPFDVAGFSTIFYNPVALSKLVPLLLSTVKEALKLVPGRQKSNNLQIAVQHPDSVAAVKLYILTKAEKSNWSRPGMYFTVDQLVRENIVPSEYAYSILDALRDMGLVTCVNWQGESVWMASQKLQDMGTMR